ncbi:type II CAAX prenyl endopeptidase Rce1 family protein [Caloramator sp. ALD01]|uniref:CPBP family glutamic-type intramembrane protease n=1 Tax=Caloramator sp. ALD01 TaxID=1031288 RepID=UPI000423693C|nr:CPBP family glutamic-type intramembrane protease [Caloramator sp. ALD01]
MKKLVLVFKILGFLILNALGLYILEMTLNFFSVYFNNAYIFNIIYSLGTILVLILNTKLFIRKDTLNFLKLYFKNIDFKRVAYLVLLASCLNIIVTLILIFLRKYTVYNFIWDKLYIEDILGVIFTGFIISLSYSIIEEVILRGYLFNMIPLKEEINIVLIALIYTTFNALSRGFNFVFIINTFLFALFLNIIYYKYKNLIYTLSFTFIWFYISNYIFSLSLEPESLDIYSVVNLMYGSFDIIGGGEYGIFGSIVFSIFLLLINLYELKSLNVFHRWTL